MQWQIYIEYHPGEEGLNSLCKHCTCGQVSRYGRSPLSEPRMLVR